MKQKIIEVKDLNFSYPDNTKALKNINFSVFQGENLAIIGPNGAGKSTLLLHLNGVLRGEGAVSIFGEKLSKDNIKNIRARVGMVFQDPNDQLFMPTVFDDIAFGLLNLGMDRENIVFKVNQVISNLGLKTYKKKAPHHLSLGEKKKVSLATVLVLEPEILVFDEPTISLDPGSKRIFMELIKKIPKTKTKIIATHDIDLAWKLCPRILLLDKGRVITEGNARDVLMDKELLEAHNLEVPPSLMMEHSGGKQDIRKIRKKRPPFSSRKIKQPLQKGWINR
ncbi:MAG: ABC transporter ATP-binding protein [Candidatus Aminicenantes bacterium]|nr:ABC transporter ATP-binding protein [Candidatus Aminicenantes bacterium]